MKTIILDGSFLAERETAHNYLKEMLDLPEHYGKNLDALYDCLTEMQAVEILIQKNGQESTCFRKLLRVFQDAQAENQGIKLNIE